MNHPIDYLFCFPVGAPRRQAMEHALWVMHRQRPDLTIVYDEYVAGDFHGINYYVHAGPDWQGATFEAHYDVANAGSENFQDNTASLCHLLYLATRHDFQGSIAFCDAEERVCYEISGSKRLADVMNRHGYYGLPVTCLELTGVGPFIWTDPHGYGGHLIRNCPVNDAVWLRRAGIDAFCCGLLKSDRETGSTWGVCHSREDTFDQANLGDMRAFNDWLLSVSSLDYERYL